MPPDDAAQAFSPDVLSDFHPDFLTIGHVTRDLLPSGGWRLGGTVTFAALTAQRLGLRAAIVTSGPADVLAVLAEMAPGVAIAALPAAEATTFENIYTGATRRQYLRGRATPLALDAVPPAWRAAPIVLLAPLAREVDPALAGAFPSALRAATPQGWLRRWADDGLVSPCPLDQATAALPHLRALILSRDDVALAAPTPDEGFADDGFAESDALLASWARIVPLVAITRGAEDAYLLRDGGPPEAFPVYPAREVDPTGAGDVFAASFLCHLHATGDARAAIEFAHRVAAYSIEHVGATGIPTPAQLAGRFGA